MYIPDLFHPLLAAKRCCAHQELRGQGLSNLIFFYLGAIASTPQTESPTFIGRHVQVTSLIDLLAVVAGKTSLT